MPAPRLFRFGLNLVNHASATGCLGLRAALAHRPSEDNIGPFTRVLERLAGS